MPTLSSKAQIWTDEDRQRLVAAIGLVQNDAIKQLFQTMQTNLFAEAMIEPIRRIQEEISNSALVQMMAAFQEIAKSQQRIFETLTASLIFNFQKQTGLGLFSSEIIDGEIQDATPKKIVHLNQSQAITVPQPQALVPVFPVRPRYETKSVMGLKEIAGRSFRYKRKTLKKVSYRNCEGRLLSLFLASRDLFVSDGDIYEKLHIPDGRSFSWILRNLKRKFRENGLSVVIERRWSPDGYILIDICYLQ